MTIQSGNIVQEEELETPPIEGVVDERHLALWWTSDNRPDVEVIIK